VTNDTGVTGDVAAVVHVADAVFLSTNEGRCVVIQRDTAGMVRIRRDRGSASKVSVLGLVETADGLTVGATLNMLSAAKVTSETGNSVVRRELRRVLTDKT
jgi:hypothetical protein